MRTLSQVIKTTIMTKQQENAICESYLVIVQKQKLSDKSICPVGECKKAQFIRYL